jgi:hypothetical protein
MNIPGFFSWTLEIDFFMSKNCWSLAQVALCNQHVTSIGRLIYVNTLHPFASSPSPHSQNPPSPLLIIEATELKSLPPPPSFPAKHF